MTYVDLSASLQTISFGSVEDSAATESLGSSPSTSNSTHGLDDNPTGRTLMAHLFGDGDPSEEEGSVASTSIKTSEDRSKWSRFAQQQSSKAVKDVINRRESILAQQRQSDGLALQTKAHKLMEQHIKVHDAEHPQSKTAHYFSCYASFCKQEDVPPFPITPDLVCLFRVSTTDTWSASTAGTCISALQRVLNVTKPVWGGCEMAAARTSRDLDGFLRKCKAIKECVTTNRVSDTAATFNKQSSRQDSIGSSASSKAGPNRRRHSDSSSQSSSRSLRRRADSPSTSSSRSSLSDLSDSEFDSGESDDDDVEASIRRVSHTLT